MAVLALERWLRPVAPLVIGAAAAGAAGLAAQEEARPAERDTTCVCSFGYAAQAPRALFGFDRARIGVLLGEPIDVGDRTGIEVREVEEGGPADRAGLRADDVLLSLDGEPLGEDPADRLIDLLGDVEPGDTVTVDYHRSGRDQTARIVTDASSRLRIFGGPARSWDFPRHMDVQALPQAVGRVRELAPAMARLRFLHGGLQLADMNEGLGTYFGVSDGVLVTDVEEDSPLGLRAGDVIVSIDGRQVRDADHVRSIITSYRADEEMGFEIVRQQRRITVSGTSGER